MKKAILIFVFGAAFTLAGAYAQSTTPTSSEKTAVPEVETEVEIQDRVQINPEDLPQGIKDSIQEDVVVQNLSISEVFQVTKEDGMLTYEIQFSQGEDIVTKKFDAEGKEIEE